MKKTLSISALRKIATIAVLFIGSTFIAFTAYLWIAYSNVLSDKVEVSADKKLLTNFDTSKFDRAEKRLEKRRDLEVPADTIHDPFGAIPE